MKRQMDALRTELTALEACLDESDSGKRCGEKPCELYEWLMCKSAELSLLKPKPMTNTAFLLYAYQELAKLLELLHDDYFNTDKEFSFFSVLRMDLIGLEDIPFPDEATETDIRMLKRSLDILREFDRFVERIGGYE